MSKRSEDEVLYELDLSELDLFEEDEEGEARSRNKTCETTTEDEEDEANDERRQIRRRRQR